MGDAKAKLGNSNTKTLSRNQVLNLFQKKTDKTLKLIKDTCENIFNKTTK